MNDVIKSRTLQLYFFGVLFLVAGFLTVLVLWPFLNSIAIAFVLAIVFKPVYRYLEKKLKFPPFLASVLSTTPTYSMNPFAFEIRIVYGADYTRGIVKTMDSDGFTLTYTKGGSPTSTVTIAYLALR